MVRALPLIQMFLALSSVSTCGAGWLQHVRKVFFEVWDGDGERCGEPCLSRAQHLGPRRAPSRWRSSRSSALSSGSARGTGGTVGGR